MRSALVALVAAAAALTAAVVACTTTDPRAGTKNGASSGSTSSGGSSSGGLDAALPDGALECGAMPGAAAPFTKAALLEAAAACASWHACNFQNAAAALRTSVGDHAAAPADQAKREAARAAWKTAMNEQSKMELFQFGPAGSRAVDKYHGRGLRTFAHPWPDLNRCQVETQVTSKDYQKGWDFVLPNSRGLFAVEYALFYPGTDIACLPNSTAAQTWATLSPEQLVSAKNDYAVAVTDNIAAVAAEVRNVWLPDGENFTAKLTAFDGYGSEQETLNVVAWSLFYPEKEIKDLKLAARAGIATSTPNPETPFALVEIENIRTNLRTWRALFQGCSADGTGVGFDDWLIQAGHRQLANDLLAAVAQAQTAADAFPAFGAATQEQFLALYQAIKPLSDLLKTSLFGSSSPLNLKLPASAASDTD
jgi:predicted lipoprotein